MKPKEIPVSHQQVMTDIGKKLRELRKAKGLSYIELAEQIGISRNSYNQLELGISNFQFITLLTVLNYYNKNVADFFAEISNG